jgi:glucosamine--fructose-6-phosphate aminotransferase (isomerizing)
VLAHLIESHLRESENPLAPLRESLAAALRAAIARIEGSQAIVACWSRTPDRLVAARIGNAGGVVVGLGQGEAFVASDLPALLTETRNVVFLADGELAELSREGVRFWSAAGDEADKVPQSVPFDPVAAAKGQYRHFMIKEIYEQPEAVLDTFRGRALFEPPDIRLEELDSLGAVLRTVERVVLVGMGTSSYAAMVGRSYIEQIAGVPADRKRSLSPSPSRARPSIRWRRWRRPSAAVRRRSLSATRPARRAPASPTARS